MFSPNMLGLNLWETKKAKKVLHGFIGIVNESKGKSNKLWADQRKEFSKSLMQNA